MVKRSNYQIMGVEAEENSERIVNIFNRNKFPKPRAQ